MDFIREYGVSSLDYEYVMHNLKKDIIDAIRLSEENVRENLTYFNGLGIYKDISKIILIRPDLLLMPNDNLVKIVGQMDSISLTNSDQRFEVDTQIDIKKVLEENFGGSIEDISTEEIMIKVSATDAGFLRSNPIHVSQKEIEKKKNYSIFYFYLKPNADFKKEILSFGSAVEILMPEGFKRSIVQEVKKMVKRNQ